MISRTQGLESLLSPQSVAVVGASDNPDKVGGRPLKYLMNQGYAGRIYAVNPRAAMIQGMTAYPSLDALPEVPDAVILCIGAHQIEDQLRLCAKLGIANAVLFASGFSEVGPEGRARQGRLADICKKGNVRLLGPNSIGVADFSTGAVLSFASVFSDHPPLDGPVSIVSQSGAMGVCAYALLRSAGWGVRCVAATGNEADLDTADFVDALARKDGVGLILLYLEDVKSTERLAAALEAAACRGVPVIALRAGRSDDGKRSAGWHTGSAGSADPAYDALFDRFGCRTVTTLNELVASVPLYLGTSWSAVTPSSEPRLALVSNSGAACVLAADEAFRRNMPLAPLSASTHGELDRLLPAFSLSRNPVDLTAMLLTDSALLGNVMQCVLEDPSVDAATLGLLAIGGASYDTERFARDSYAAAEALAKPMAVYSPHVHVRAIFAAHGHAVFEHESAALNALQGFFQHRARFQSQSPQPNTLESNHV